MVLQEWNVVATAHAEGFQDACRELERFAPVQRTGYADVLVLKVGDIEAFLSAFDALLAAEPGILNFVSRVVPAQHAFNFRSGSDFEEQARDVALGWVADLAGKRFHVRMHRRGFKGQLQSPAEERFLDEVLLAALEAAAAPGAIAFDDPDAILSVETVDDCAGLSLWSRRGLETRPYLGLD